MYRCAKQCVPLMRLSPCLVSPVPPILAPAPAPTSEPSHDRSCSIINISSTRALMSEPDTEAYAASKGAIVALTHALAASLGKFKIRVNCISPGWIEVCITRIMPSVCFHYWSIHLPLALSAGLQLEEEQRGAFPPAQEGGPCPAPGGAGRRAR
eukprot:TRINITY_DN9207_c0_g1_i4.p1 TRINITY_DN9207_c0_g1~~TRINITY_DN9207_c0_g1_i4.p1  ORF type:complete len:154 (-),score=16.20 TRINITY_DN9207_c0_g1_i4:191-652(-)